MERGWKYANKQLQQKFTGVFTGFSVRVFEFHPYYHSSSYHLLQWPCIRAFTQAFTRHVAFGLNPWQEAVPYGKMRMLMLRWNFEDTLSFIWLTCRGNRALVRLYVCICMFGIDNKVREGLKMIPVPTGLDTNDRTQFSSKNTEMLWSFTREWDSLVSISAYIHVNRSSYFLQCEKEVETGSSALRSLLVI